MRLPPNERDDTAVGDANVIKHISGEAMCQFPMYVKIC
jgi:hypothetical protein